MKRLKRWTFRLLLLAILLAVGLLAAWIWVVPGMVERRITAALADAGLPGSSVHIDFVGLDRAFVSDIVIGADARLRARGALVTYDVGGLRNGRINSLQIVGAELNVKVHDGIVDFGDLAKAHGSDDGGEFDLPMEKLELVAAEVIAELPGRTVRVPLRGTVTKRGAQSVHVDLSGSMGSRRATIAGDLNLAGGRARSELIKLSVNIPRIAATDGVSLAGVDAAVKLSLDAGPRDIRIGALTGSQVTAETLTAAVVGATLRSDTSDEPAAAVSVGPKPIMLTVKNDNGVVRWSLTAEDLNFKSGPIGGMIASPVVEIERLRLAARVKCTADAQGLVVTLLEPAQLRAGTLLALPATQNLRLDNTVLLINEIKSRPLAVVTSNGVATHFSVANAADRALLATGTIAGVTFDHADALVAMSWDSKKDLTLNSNLKLAGGTVSYSPARLVARGVEINVPITLNSDAPPSPGKLTIAGLELGDDKLPGVTGTAGSADGRVTLAADWKLSDAIVAHITGEIDSQHSQYTVKLPRTEIVDGHLAGSLFSALRDVQLDGGVALDGQFTITAGKFEPRVKLELFNAGFHAAQWQASAEKVSGSVTLTSLAPLATPGRQQLTAAKLNVGKMIFEDGALDFRVIDSHSAFLEKAGFRIGSSGRFTAHAIALDAAKPGLDTDIYVEGVNLGDLLTVLTGEPITGSGLLYGRVPVSFRPENARKLTFKPGFIYANPGPGTLKLTDPNRVADLLNKVDPEFLKGPELSAVRDQAVEALSDFEYSLFRFEITPDADGQMMLQLQARGKGRSAKTPVEFTKLEINVHGFEEAANDILFIKMNLDKTLDTALDRFFDRVQK